MLDKRKARERILAALHSYVDLGLPIIPCCSHDHVGYSERHIATCNQAGKIPLIRGWREHEVTTKAQIKSWISEFRNLNIGLPLGDASGYIGIDVDGEMGEEMLVEMSGGDLPATWEYITGAGRRLLYQIPVGMKTKKYVNTGEGEHEECSILAEGQQTILPPSIHHTGRVYEWFPDHSPDDIDCAIAPPWLINLVRDDDKHTPGTVDLTRPGVPDFSVEKKDIKPLIITDDYLPVEFTDFESVDVDLTPPDSSYVGKKAKIQEEEDSNKISSEELMQKISAGGRDNQMTRIIGSFCAQFRALGKDYIMLMAKNHNKMFCDPPLDELSIEAKVTHFWELEQMKSAKFKNLAGGEDQKKRFAPGAIAQVVINQLEEQGYVLKVDPEQAVIWMTKKEQGPWEPLDSKSSRFQLYLREALGNPELGGDPTWTTIRHYKDAAHAVVIELRSAGRIWETNTSNMDTQTMESFKYIPLAGGKLLDWRKGELLPWNPDSNLTYVLPVEYDPNARAPYWERRLEEWLPDEGSRLIMQEFIGYTLIPYMGFEKALVIQGEGANGKSLFLETIQGLLGYKVVDSINMRNLFSRFGQADLVGKILNIVNEAGSEYLRGSHADDFKNLVSGGRIKADVKNQSPLTFNNTAKFIFASNHDIKTGDKSEGWLRRMLIVPFEQDFRNSPTPKYEIMEQLRSEYAGIFNWAVEGLQRLLKNRQFSSSEVVNRKRAKYVQENDISADFFMNCLETFELVEVSSNNKKIRKGVPSALVNALFAEWIEYRESSVQKKVEHLTNYLERKHKLTKFRTTHVMYVKKSMTECWIGLKLNITDTGFLEKLVNEPIMKFPELKSYAEEQLAKIDAAEGYSSTGEVVEANVPTNASIS